MSSNEDPSARRDQEEKGTEEVEVGGRSAEGGENEAVGGGDGTTTDVAGVMEGVGGGGEAAAAEDGVGEAVGPSSYTDQEVTGMTPDQALAAVTRGSLRAHQNTQAEAH